jgi:hypothetical protein
MRIKAGLNFLSFLCRIHIGQLTHPVECQIERIVDTDGDHAMAILREVEAEYREEVRPLGIAETPREYGISIDAGGRKAMASMRASDHARCARSAAARRTRRALFPDLRNLGICFGHISGYRNATEIIARGRTEARLP